MPVSTSATSSSSSSLDLRRRVILHLNKLSDRDTLPLAAAELEAIARGLGSDSFSPFLGCVSSAADSAEKSPVGRQCVRLLAVMSEEHGDELAPHLQKMLSAVVRRVRDSDSAVRAACVESVASMASKITKPPFSSFMKPLVDAVLHEQDYNSQIGSAMCLAAAIDASPDPDLLQLQKLLPKLLKLVRNDCFKAKPALLSLIGSIAGVGGARNRNLLNNLISNLVQFLSSEDWATRKAAAEALAKLAGSEPEMLSEFRSSCLASLENRRFDKVKIVRDTMNSTLAAWKAVPGIPEKVSPQPQSQCRSPSKDDGGPVCSPLSGSTCRDIYETPEPKRSLFKSGSPSSDSSFATTKQRSPSENRRPNASLFSKWSSKDSEVACADDLKEGRTAVVEVGSNETNSKPKLEMRRALFGKNFDERVHKIGSWRSGSRVVPFYENKYGESDVVHHKANQDVDVNQKEVEDLDVIREQLVQIENQQSNLLELLQRFIGSSQSGMHFLENRVNGLEKALGEISQDLAVSSSRFSVTESSRNSCCMLPGAEFLSPKFWRRTEGPHSCSSISLSKRNHSISAPCANSEMQKVNECEHLGESSRSPLEFNQVNLMGKLEHRSCENLKMSPDRPKIQLRNASGSDGTLLSHGIVSGSINCRSSTQVAR